VDLLFVCVLVRRKSTSPHNSRISGLLPLNGMSKGLVIMKEKHVAYNRAGANRNLLNLDCDPVGANHKMERSLRMGGRLTGKKMDASM
jgi:hypothetical protein